MLQPPTLQNELPQVSFQHNYFPSFFWAATLFLAKKFHKSLLQKSETKIFKQKIFREKLVQSQREKNLGVLRLNKIMSKLLTVSVCSYIAS